MVLSALFTNGCTVWDLCVGCDRFSTRQVEGLQSKCLIWRKVAFHLPPLFARSVLGAGAWRFQRDLGGMKSPILGPGFGNGQET
ncbi:unnamed protein product, partial [Staurois parvus]